MLVYQRVKSRYPHLAGETHSWCVASLPTCPTARLDGPRVPEAAHFFMAHGTLDWDYLKIGHPKSQWLGKRSLPSKWPLEGTPKPAVDRSKRGHLHIELIHAFLAVGILDPCPCRTSIDIEFSYWSSKRPLDAIQFTTTAAYNRGCTRSWDGAAGNSNVIGMMKLLQTTALLFHR